MIGLLALTGFVGLFIPFAKCQDSYCAFEVRVTRPSRAPVVNVPVYLVRDRATIADTTTDVNGLAKLCDAPLKPVDIAVGFDVCGSVVVRDIEATWPAMRQIFVTYMETPCNHFVFDGK